MKISMKWLYALSAGLFVYGICKEAEENEVNAFVKGVNTGINAKEVIETGDSALADAEADNHAA